MEVPFDLVPALADWLTDNGHAAVPWPLPDDFQGSLPLTCLRDSGGSRTWPVIDRHRIGVDVYGTDAVEAMAEAREVFALLDEINTTHPAIGGVQAYGVAFGGLPQPQTDPEHMDAPMATFLAEVSMRSVNQG